MPSLSPIAEAVKDALNAGSFALTFTATRVYLPTFELRSLGDLTVVVWPNDLVSEVLSRATAKRLYTIDVAVMKKVDVSDNTIVDPLMLFVEELGDNFEGNQLTGYTSVTCIRWELVPVVDWEQMKANRQFTSVLRFTFR